MVKKKSILGKIGSNLKEGYKNYQKSAAYKRTPKYQKKQVEQLKLRNEWLKEKAKEEKMINDIKKTRKQLGGNWGTWID